MAQASPRTVSVCPICETDGTLANERWDLDTCASCHHVWSTRPLAESPNEMFEEADYAQWRVDSPTQRQRQEAIAELRLRHLRDRIPGSGRALEIGCSTGEVIAALCDRGWEGYGIDLAAAAIDVGRANHPNVNLAAAGSPAEAGFPSTDYDLVMAFHVIEHVPDPASFVAMAHDALRPGGTLYLRMPNWQSWSRRVLGDYWPSHVPEHLHHFSPPSIDRLLTATGFDRIESATCSQSRYWVGGARRALSRDWTPSEAMTPVSERSLQMLAVADAVTSPLLRLEERLDRGGELIVTATKR